MRCNLQCDLDVIRRLESLATNVLFDCVKSKIKVIFMVGNFFLLVKVYTNMKSFRNNISEFYGIGVSVQLRKLRVPTCGVF